MTSQNELFFVQITDQHLINSEDDLVRGTKPAPAFRKVLEDISNLPETPEFFLVTGDMKNDEGHDSYDFFDEFMKPFGVPYYWIAGNHDHYEVMKKQEETLSVNPAKSFEKKGIRFILLNSSIYKTVAGELSKAELEFLEYELQKSKNQPCIISLHHQPLPVGSPWMDVHKLQNSDDFFQVLDKFSNVKAVIFGHVHQEFETERNGVKYFACPSTVFQFKPKSETFAYGDELPGYRTFRISLNGDIETKVHRVDFFQQPEYKNN